ncbi:hypothetical protein LOAG_12068 [Loa loa]|uniref:Transmembrane protein n=1 Tax=Loa loa TaxID=7209 RepID=A0A1I7W5W5_LOALO|nr:hypothetical protein LOAG_12068 [Loa loa]EFO16438.1 hypothetical protein LOAG_12068 [Loa loa]
MEIDSGDMDSILEAELSEDGSMHVKPAITHVINVPWLSHNLVPFTRTTNLPLTARNGSESFPDQDNETKSMEIPVTSDNLESITSSESKAKFQAIHTITNNSDEFPDKIEATTICCFNFDITEKIAILQSKSNQDVEVETFQSIAMAKSSKPEFESEAKSVSGNLGQTNHSVEIIALIKLTKQKERNNEKSKAAKTNLSIISVSIACLIVFVFY